MCPSPCRLNEVVVSTDAWTADRRAAPIGHLGDEPILPCAPSNNRSCSLVLDDLAQAVPSTTVQKSALTDPVRHRQYKRQRNYRHPMSRQLQDRLPLARLTGRSVLALLLAMSVVSLTLFGALNDVPAIARGIAQAVGTIAGVYLGARYQAVDERTASEGTARAALANLVALARGLKYVIATTDAFRARMAITPPSTIAAFQYTSETLLAGLDSQARALLSQVGAAASAWMPYLPNSDPYLRTFTGDADND